MQKLAFEVAKWLWKKLKTRFATEVSLIDIYMFSRPGIIPIQYIRVQNPADGAIALCCKKVRLVRITRAGSRANIIAWIALNGDSTP